MGRAVMCNLLGQPLRRRNAVVSPPGEQLELLGKGKGTNSSIVRSPMMSVGWHSPQWVGINPA